MSNIRLSTVNLLDKDTYAPTIKNGTGGGAPARDERTGYLMDNALYRDRYTAWGTAATPASPLYFDVDLGSDKSVACAAVLGLRAATGVPATCVVKSATAAAGYAPGPWTTRATLTLGSTTERDAGAVFAATSARYWRFEFTTVSTAFYLGRLWLGASDDLGMLYSKGSSETPIVFGVSDVLPGGIPVDAYIGDEGRMWSLRFETVLAATRNSWLTALRTKQSFVLFDDADACFEVRLPQRSVPTDRTAYNVYTVNVELTRLP